MISFLVLFFCLCSSFFSRLFFLRLASLTQWPNKLSIKLLFYKKWLLFIIPINCQSKQFSNFIENKELFKTFLSGSSDSIEEFSSLFFSKLFKILLNSIFSPHSLFEILNSYSNFLIYHSFWYKN